MQRYLIVGKMLPTIRNISLVCRLIKATDAIFICRRSYGILGSPSKLQGPEIPNADLDNRAIEIDLPIVKKAIPSLRPFDAFNEKVAWTDSVKDKLYEFIELELRGHDAAVLRSYQWFLSESARHLDIEVSRVFDKVPTQEHLSVLKSAFIYKKHQVQYEWRTFFKYIQLRHLTESTALTYLEYIQRNLPEGVAMNVAYLEMRPMPEYLQQPPSAEEELEERKESTVTDDADDESSAAITADGLRLHDSTAEIDAADTGNRAKRVSV